MPEFKKGTRQWAMQKHEALQEKSKRMDLTKAEATMRDRLASDLANNKYPWDKYPRCSMKELEDNGQTTISLEVV
jgi:hypothetical protein